MSIEIDWSWLDVSCVYHNNMWSMEKHVLYKAKQGVTTFDPKAFFTFLCILTWKWEKCWKCYYSAHENLTSFYHFNQLQFNILFSLHVWTENCKKQSGEIEALSLTLFLFKRGGKSERVFFSEPFSLLTKNTCTLHFLHFYSS